MRVLTTAATRLAGVALIATFAFAAPALADQSAKGTTPAASGGESQQPAAGAAGQSQSGSTATANPDSGDKASAAGNQSDFEKHPYIVKDGKVDYGTYDGYRRYAGTCHVCHGPDGLGSSFAPSLVDALKTMSYSQFLDTVVNGKKNVSASQNLVMPSFANNTDIMMTIDHIYAYLKARSDGVIGRGRPERMDPDKDPVWKAWKANNQ